MPQPYPRNGSVQVYECHKTIHINGTEIETPNGFIFVWWRANGDPGDEGNHFDTREEAERAAREYAQAKNAVYWP
jgi:hypothetical protein